jgi:hypothetical protein
MTPGAPLTAVSRRDVGSAAEVVLGLTPPEQVSETPKPLTHGASHETS